MALEDRDKKAVGAVPCRRQPEIILAAGRGAADCLFPNASHGQQRKIGLRGEKRLGLCFVFVAQQRAGGVDEASAGTDEARGAAQDQLLTFDELGEIFGTHAPFGVGVAAPSAGAEAGNVSEDSVEAGFVVFHPLIALAAQPAAFHIGNAGSAQPARRSKMATKKPSVPWRAGVRRK